MKKIWDFFSGKKTTIALIYWTVIVPALPILFENGVPNSIEKAAVILGYLLSAIGLGHAGLKQLSK